MKNKFIALTVLFAVLLTLTPQLTPTTTAYATVEDGDDSTTIRSGVVVARPHIVRTNRSAYLNYMQSVKIKANWDVYINGLGSAMYSLSVKNNVLKITGKNCIDSGWHVYAVKNKFQLFRPGRWIDTFLGTDGLAYVDHSSHIYKDAAFVTNTAVLSSNTLILAPDDGETTVKDLLYEMDLSNLSDDIYCFKELIWDLNPNCHKGAEYYYNLVVVVSDGIASLQATEHSYDVLPKAPDGRITYGKWWANAHTCSRGYIGCGIATCGGW